MTPQQASGPIIVYGAPRSGTTYLREILCAHPDVFITDEAWVFLWVHQMLTKLSTHIQQERHRPRQGHPQPVPRLSGIEELGAHVRAISPGVVQAFYRRLNPDLRHWGDKHPTYLGDEDPGCLETILELFPDTRFVHIIRDGRDVAASAMRKSWLSFEAGLQQWRRSVDRGSSFGRRLPPGQYLELRYEDLVANDVGVARALFAFLDIPLHPAVERFCQAQRNERTPVSAPTRDLSRGAGHSGREEGLTPLQRRQSLEIAGEHLIRYGYETETSLAELERRLAPLATPTLIRSIREITHAIVPMGSILLVVSEGDDELLRFENREASPFPQTDEGQTEETCLVDDTMVIAQLEELRTYGANFLLVPRPAFWWLDYYPGVRQYLEDHYAQLWSDDQCVIYRLNSVPRSVITRFRRNISPAP